MSISSSGHLSQSPLTTSDCSVPPRTPLIELDHLTRLYGTVMGVNDLCLTLAPGAYGLLGPNGAGKSTLLNLLTGQLRPSLGSVRVLGETPRNNPACLARMGYLPGSEGMYANVSALDWVSYLVELQGFGRRIARQRAEQALDRVGMSAHRNRIIAEFSRGQRQRTRLAQAIAHEPEFLILDEPFNGLDPVARHDVAMLLKGWIADGKSLILASHVLHEIEAITRSFLLISGGRLLAYGAADQIHEMLANTPRETTLRTSAPSLLAAKLLEAQVADAVRLTGTDSLVAVSRNPLKLFEFLAQVSGDGVVVTELRGSDQSLQEIFQSLLRRQRGRQ